MDNVLLLRSDSATSVQINISQVLRCHFI